MNYAGVVSLDECAAAYNCESVCTTHTHTHTHTHTVPTVSTEEGMQWTRSWLAWLARGNSQSFHLLPDKSAIQTQWGFFWLRCVRPLSSN